MRLESSTSIFNMGDTSLRVKQVVDVYRVVLEHIQRFMKNKTWKKNPRVQEEFYINLLNTIVSIEEEDGLELFSDFKRRKNYIPPKPDKIGLRGRTATNGLVKTGLIDINRKLSEVGENYLNDDLEPTDPLEETLGLQTDNIVYLRQFLKLRVYSSNSDKFFYNYRFALKFLSKHKNVPQNDFLKILLSVRPEQSLEELNKIISDYKNVSNNNELFDNFYKDKFSNLLRSKEELLEAKEMFLNYDFSDDNFIKFFSNRDSNQTVLLYKDFVLNLIQLIDKQDEKAFQKIKKLSRDNKIKKAFGENKIPFIFQKNETLEEFLEHNQENPLLSRDHYQIYLVFIFSKHNDLIREYSDMCRRTFQITGLISFDNGLVNLNNDWIITPLLDLLGDSFKITGEESYKNYELAQDSPWFKDNSTMQILDISLEKFNDLLHVIGERLNISDFSFITQEIHNKQEQEYRDFIRTHFPIKTVCKILEYINTRNDEKVFELVTDNATIPTIYEYILTIAWYHLSTNKDFDLHQTFQVTLDGNKLPLSHRGGGSGDIEIITDDYRLLIEATLMDKNTQRRGELEPVIRHSINFSIQNQPNTTQTIFIANELDQNVLNIFRGTQFIELVGTLQNGQVRGLNIFAFTTEEIIRLLESDIRDLEILQKINDNLDTIPTQISTNWRESIIDSIIK